MLSSNLAKRFMVSEEFEHQGPIRSSQTIRPDESDTEIPVRVRYHRSEYIELLPGFQVSPGVEFIVLVSAGCDE